MTVRFLPARIIQRALGMGAVEDIAGLIRLAFGGAVALWFGEIALTAITYPGAIGVVDVGRMAAIAAALIALLFFAIIVIGATGLLFVHASRRLLRFPGRSLLPNPIPNGPTAGGPARVWAALIVGAISVVIVRRWVLYVEVQFRERQLAATLTALVVVAAAPVIVLAARLLGRAIAKAANKLGPKLGAWSPLGRWLPAYLTLWSLGLGALAAMSAMSPAVRSVAPWRPLCAAMMVGLGAGVAFAAPGRWRRRWSRSVALGVSAATTATISLALLYFGRDSAARSLAVNGSPPLAKLVAAVRALNDFDGDGFGSLLGENDCRPFNPAIHPMARDVPDNGVDENCNGRDFSMRDLARPTAQGPTVPAAFRRPWNILFLTVDTVRYDHTSFGGYATGPKKRDTTPQLAKLVGRSTSFTFAQAPSAGTMGSIPALLTSKFFHSGVALDVAGVKPGMPPRMRPENLLISEILKTRGYTTGAITSHEYFNDWGMEQGFDTYDNSIGKVGDPKKVTSHLLTDRALAWISQHEGKKWFLWVHYLDPHGRYVAHPDHVSFGNSEEDLYDGELAYTDHHLGRLFTELARSPEGGNTIIVLTSDHGDAFNEHGFINHGQALYRELLHVPLIVHVPDNPPRELGGAVSGMDVVPTMAELAGVDLANLVHDGKAVTFEGKSLVPQIFFGGEDAERAVFAETNFPHPLRAATSQKYKVIFNLKNNLAEVYDLAADPWEKSNLAHRPPPGAVAVREQLELWMERVLFARDPVFNQAAEKMNEILLNPPSPPPLPLPPTLLDSGRLRAVGVGIGTSPTFVTPKAGTSIDVRIHFDVVDKPSGPLRLQLVAWPVAAGAAATQLVPAEWMRFVQRTPLRVSADGMFPADRWRSGDRIRERFAISLPPDWPTPSAGIGVVVADSSGNVQTPAGTPAGGDARATALGVMPLLATQAP